MKTTMIALLATLTMTILPNQAWASPKVIAAKFHADYCGSCKAIAPAYKDAMSEHADSDVLFVVMDKTDEATSNQARLMAEALDIERIYAEQKKTGYVLLIDAKSKEVKGKLLKTHSAKQMAAAIDGVLAGKDMMMKGSAKETMKAKGSAKTGMGSKKGSGY